MLMETSTTSILRDGRGVVYYGFWLLVSGFWFLVSRFSFLVSRFSFLVSRFSFLVSRFSFLMPLTHRAILVFRGHIFVGG